MTATHAEGEAGTPSGRRWEIHDLSSLSSLPAAGAVLFDACLRFEADDVEAGLCSTCGRPVDEHGSTEAVAGSAPGPLQETRPAAA